MVLIRFQVLALLLTAAEALLRGTSFGAWHAKGALISPLRMADKDGKGSSLWRERVEFVDLSAAQVAPSSNSREMPLFLLGGAFFPEGTTVLNVFEMKYRTMMFDCANSDDTFGYFMVDGSGRIASVGTMCKIVERRLIEDGRQVIQIVGVGRCRVNKILKTLPYVMAEVEPDLVDDSPPAPQGEVSAVKLERETWDALKYYMRLMRSYEPNKNTVVPPAVKRNRPTQSNELDAIRRTKFSFSLAHMIQMSHPQESQLLLQTTSIIKRLEAMKMILNQAAESIADQLIQMDVLNASVRDGMKFESMSKDYDEDILPPDVVEQEVKEEKDPWDIQNVE